MRVEWPGLFCRNPDRDGAQLGELLQEKACTALVQQAQAGLVCVSNGRGYFAVTGSRMAPS